MKRLHRLLKKGLKKTTIAFISYLYDLYFDAKYNLDTNSWVTVDELDVDDSKKEHAVLYQATRVLPLRKLFERLQIPKENVLIDIGCGKGRVLLMASEYGFEDVRGIEFSPILCSIADENILKYRYRTQTRKSLLIINADAAEYQYGDEDVFFFYNPFDEVILKKVLQNISTSLKKRNRKIWMIYANAVHRELIEKTMKIIRVKEYNFFEFEFVVYEVELANLKSG